MLADSKLPTTFWAEAVSTACYVQNKVLVVKPHFKTSYELFKGRSHALSFMRSFGCYVSILNTLDQLGKFDGKSDEGIFVGYSTISKAFRVFTWVFFLATKDETSRILKSFITEIENLVENKVKMIRCDNGTEFKNRVMNEFYEEKGIKREYILARTPQQYRVVERRNRT
nr:retrovirus-related Pol polyprotein from transposon TNT 1-94 [Tanacetum cinerariifolium]